MYFSIAKMHTLCVVAITMHLISYVCASKLPSFLHPCKRNDPELNKCIEKSAQMAIKMFSKGVPELNIPSLDPVTLDKITINAPGLKVVYEDTVLTGLGDGNIENVRLNLDKLKIRLDFVGNVTLAGKYKINGRVLILPIIGNGLYLNKLTNLRMTLKHNIKRIIMQDGEEHWFAELTSRTFKLDKAYFNFSNLFEGNKLLGDTTLRFLNDNWQIIMKEIAPPAIDQIVKMMVETINILYEKVPVKDYLL